MLYIDVMSRTPVYEQIINSIEKLISAGLLKEGEQLPSVRSLSVELSVNPNTIQKAYSELDSMGLITSVPGRGCFIRHGAVDMLRENAKKRLSDICALAESLMAQGVSKEEIIEAISNTRSPNNNKEESK